MVALPYEADAGGLSLKVRLTPRGGRDALEGTEVLADGRTVLKARVRAVPEKGSANAALEKLIAKALGVPKSAVAVVGGKASRVKTVKVAGEPQRIAVALQALSESLQQE